MGEALEDYLEAILILSNQNKAVRSVDLAVYRGYSRASISYAVKELRNKNYLEVNKDGHLKLTSSGQVLANRIYERHCFFKKLLIYSSSIIAVQQTLEITKNTSRSVD